MAPETCAGMAEAGEPAGKGWLKWIVWELEWWELWCGGLAVGWAPVCIVVRVVVRERTEGAGDEKVLSPPRRPAVRLVPAREGAPWEGARMERPQVVGGGCSSLERRTELDSRDITLRRRRLGPEEREYSLCGGEEGTPTRPDWGYGLLRGFFGRFEVEAGEWPASPDEGPLKFASFFIRAEKGRRRPALADRSGALLEDLSWRRGVLHFL